MKKEDRTYVNGVSTTGFELDEVIERGQNIREGYFMPMITSAIDDEVIKRMFEGSPKHKSLKEVAIMNTTINEYHFSDDIVAKTSGLEPILERKYCHILFNGKLINDNVYRVTNTMFQNFGKADLFTESGRYHILIKVDIEKYTNKELDELLKWYPDKKKDEMFKQHVVDSYEVYDDLTGTIVYSCGAKTHEMPYLYNNVLYNQSTKEYIYLPTGKTILSITYGYPLSQGYPSGDFVNECKMRGTDIFVFEGVTYDKNTHRPTYYPVLLDINTGEITHIK